MAKPPLQNLQPASRPRPNKFKNTLHVAEHNQVHNPTNNFGIGTRVKKHRYTRSRHLSAVFELLIFINIAVFITLHAIDVTLAIQYLYAYKKEEKDYLKIFGILTLLMRFVGLFITCGLSLVWFKNDFDGLTFKVTAIHFFQIHSCWRYWRVKKLANEVDDSYPIDNSEFSLNEYLEKLDIYNLEEKDASLTKFIQSFTTSALQIIVQLILIFTLTYYNNPLLEKLEYLIWFSVLINALDLFLAICFLQHILLLTMSQQGKMGVKVHGLTRAKVAIFFDTIAQFLLLIPRVCALMALFLNTPLETMRISACITIVAIHWLFHSIYLCLMDTQYTEKRETEWMFCGLIGTVWVFIYLPIKEYKKRWKGHFEVFIFYAIQIVENLWIIHQWYFVNTDKFCQYVAGQKTEDIIEQKKLSDPCTERIQLGVVSMAVVWFVGLGLVFLSAIIKYTVKVRDVTETKQVRSIQQPIKVHQDRFVPMKEDDEQTHSFIPVQEPMSAYEMNASSNHSSMFDTDTVTRNKLWINDQAKKFFTKFYFSF